MQLHKFPFRILALAPFTMDTSLVWEKPPLSVERQSLDEVMSAMGIIYYLSLESNLSASGGLSFQFDNLKSLHPDGIARTHPFFKQITQANNFIKHSHRQDLAVNDIAKGLEQWPDLPAIKFKSSSPALEKRKARQDAVVDHILDMVAIPGDSIDTQPVYNDENDHIAAIQQGVLNQLFDQPAFRRMEAAWRGLRLLLQQGIPNNSVKVEVAPIQMETLTAALDAITPHLVQNPPGLILLDLAFDNTPVSMERLTHVGQWAANLMVPVVAWCPAEFFQINTWGELESLPFIPNHVDGPAYAKFLALKSSDMGHWLCLTCNRFLIRYPYGIDNRPRHVTFNESKPLWISPAWALATTVALSTDQTGWPTRFTDRHQFCLQDLALLSEAGIPSMVVETILSRDRIDQFIRAGITPLASQAKTDKAFFSRSVTTSGNSLAYQLLASRVTAYILWCKDNRPEQTSPSVLEDQLRLDLQLFSELSDPPGFDSIEIDTGASNTDGSIPVAVSLKPSASNLPSQQEIELSLNW